MPRPRDRLASSAWPYALGALALVVHLAWLARKGFQTSPDTWYYMGAAQALREGGVSALLHVTGAGKYVSSIALLALLQALTRSDGTHAWVLVGTIASALAVVPLAFAARDLWGPRGALVTGLAYVASFEILQWSNFALTDSVFIAACVALVAATLRAWRAPTRSRVVGVLLLAALVATLRVAGVAMVAAVGVWWLAARANARWTALPRAVRARPALWIALVAIILAVVGLVGISELNRGLGAYYASGRVLDDDPSTYVAPVGGPAPSSLLAFVAHHPVDYARITLLKAADFWTVFARRYSTGHDLVNALTLLPLVVLGFVGIGIVVARRERDPTLWLAPWLVIVMTLFHATTVVDYDLRYRSPVLPLLALCAPLPIELALRWGRRARQGTADADGTEA